MARKPATNAIIRTVTAVTMFNAGIKVIDYDRSIINDDRVKIRALYSMESHPMAGVAEEDFGYQMIKTSIRQVWNGTYVAPGTMIGNTDTRHYLKFTKNVYRFSPTVMFPEDVARFHGDNERISIKNFEQAINFYYHLILNSNKEKLDPPHKHGEL